MKYKLIAEKGNYALIQRGNNIQEYAVVNGLNKETGQWDWTCVYYGYCYCDAHLEMSKEMALFKAIDYFLNKTDDKFISYERISDIARGLVLGLIEDGKQEAYEYMRDVLEMTDEEMEYFNLF